MNIGKKVLIGFIVINAYMIIMDSLEILGIAKMTDYHAQKFNIFYSLGISIAILMLIKNSYWIIAGVFGLFHTISQIISAFLFRNYHDIYIIPIFPLMVVGLICLIASSYYYYKLFKVKEFDFEGNIRLDKLIDSLKKKYRSGK